MNPRAHLSRSLVFATTLLCLTIASCGGGSAGGGSGGGGNDAPPVEDTTAPTVAASSSGGTYSAPLVVTLQADEDAEIYYTLDGSSPGSTYSFIYEAPIRIDATTTLKFLARDGSKNQSAVVVENYVIDLPVPTVSLSPSGGGPYPGTLFVSLGTAANAVIYYTTDGSMPTANSPMYYGPIRIPPDSSVPIAAATVDRDGNVGIGVKKTYRTGSAITDLKVENTGGAQIAVPVTFGQVFAPGDIPSTFSVIGTLTDGSAIPLQVDAKNTHADGSLRHAVISTVLPRLDAGQAETIYLRKGAVSAKVAQTPAGLVADGFSASVRLTESGVAYSASAVPQLNASNYVTWLQGPIANEWIVSAPLLDAASQHHPHLSVRFTIRAYAGMKKAKVDVVVENDWAYAASPGNFTYAVDVQVGGSSVYNHPALTHYHHARWHRAFWWNGAPDIHVVHNPQYLVHSRALPNFDSGAGISSSALAMLSATWAAAPRDPMQKGLIRFGDLATTERAPEIGPLPNWGALYLLSMDRGAKDATLGMGSLAGSYSVHYRDLATNLPVLLLTHPRMTVLGSAAEAGNDAFPSCPDTRSTDPCFTPYRADAAHQPSFAYLPYLVSGDHFYLEELQFWANWNMLRSDPDSRSFDRGLMKWDDVRGQAWSLRTLGQAAYITPDDHPLKRYFVDRVNDNIDWYLGNYVSISGNGLGFLDGSGRKEFQPYVFDSANIRGAAADGVAIAPWHDDLFTWTAGYLVDLGFSNAEPFLNWKARFAIGRMTDPAYCWTDASSAYLSVRATPVSSFVTSFGEAYRLTMRQPDGSPLTLRNGSLYLDQACGSQSQADWRTRSEIETGMPARHTWQAGEMVGNADDVAGLVASMQPGLAAAVGSGIAGSRAAWERFVTRQVKPNYADSPQWNVVPRTQ